ncbi:hypothetical protein GA0111570_101341 [Raineyella antarctica]|uniref:General stress protein 17M-like domain-containing protein n=1 Tax=Raineyella antarctica TaxID=1577474 RepID=A0A1G6GDJ6_9ACTN|nr:general stress protein [Raineyella antarctica]SDB80067.1 hypothetical protein GA0111570_101341 [Raineyella antarctica]
MAVPDPRRLASLFELEFPQLLATYNSYAEAQRAVDYLSDKSFPVQNLAIVGTDLRSVERVTGRKDWGTVVNRGLSNGLSIGLLFGVMAMLFYPPQTNIYELAAIAVVVGVVISVVFALIGYLMTRGRRDFTSVTQTIATRYEVLCEHKVSMKARELLAQMPGGRNDFR